jgi:hypothetical protein
MPNRPFQLDHRKLRQRKDRLEEQSAVMGTILRGLAQPQESLVEYIDVKGPHAYGTEATVLLKAPFRSGAVDRMGLFPPHGLDMAQTPNSGGTIIIPAYTQLKGSVLGRASIVPFTYTVVQVRKVARHTVNWITVINGVKVAVACDVGRDRAALTLEHFDDVGHNQVLWRRVPNPYLPDGARREMRGHEWSPIKDVPASITIWWPYTHHRITQALGAPERNLSELAHLLLEVSLEEAQ